MCATQLFFLASGDGALPVLIFLGFGALVGGLIYWSHLTAKKRTEALRSIAASLGMEFDTEKYQPENLGLGAVSSLNKGSSRKAFNVMRGTFADAECLLFDYRYTTGSGKNSSTYEQTVVAFRVLGAELPVFTCRPEHFFHKFANFLGYEDINFDEFPRFSDTYRLNGNDEAAIRSIFNANVIRQLEAERVNPWTIDGGGDWLVLHQTNKKVVPNDIAQFLLDGTTLLNEMTLK